MPTIAFKYDMGVVVKDPVTGFQGTITGMAVFFTGCNRVLVEPPLAEDGKMVDPVWFDEQRVERVVEEPKVESPTRTTFNTLKKKGYQGFYVDKDGQKAGRMDDFDPEAAMVIMVPKIQGG